MKRVRFIAPARREFLSEVAYSQSHIIRAGQSTGALAFESSVRHHILKSFML